MRIDEFDNTVDDKLPFDVVDDISVFMRNDPMFYRKSFFPVVDRMRHCHRKGTEFDYQKEIGEVVDRAANTYCRKFKINRRPENLMDDNERDELIKKLYAEEMTQIRKGVYDK